MKSAISLSLDTDIRVKKYKKCGEVTVEAAFKNVVLDAGRASLLSRIMNANSNTDNAPKYLFLGTGTTTPMASDPGLESPASGLPGKRAASFGHMVDSPTGGHVKYTTRMRFDYDEGEAEGTWTELGLAFGESYTEPYNRSLFKDENGSPISITVLSDEYLQVFIDLIIYVPWGEVASGSFIYDGHQHTWSLVGDNYYSMAGYANPFRDQGVFNDPIISDLARGSDGDYSFSRDVENATVSIQLHVRHGEERQISTIQLRNARTLHPQRTHHIYFDPPIHKKYEDRLFGEIEYSLDIGEVPE